MLAECPVHTVIRRTTIQWHGSVRYLFACRPPCPNGDPTISECPTRAHSRIDRLLGHTIPIVNRAVTRYESDQPRRRRRRLDMSCSPSREADPARPSPRARSRSAPFIILFKRRRVIVAMALVTSASKLVTLCNVGADGEREESPPPSQRSLGAHLLVQVAYYKIQWKPREWRSQIAAGMQQISPTFPQCR